MSILSKAETIVNGERQCDYDEPTGSFNKVAQIASLLTHKDLTAKDCCLVLIAVKLARESFKHKEDNLVDLAGYAELLNRIEEQEQAPKVGVK
jgi:hypothetical protein